MKNKRLIYFFKKTFTKYNILFIFQFLGLIYFLSEICLAEYFPFVRWEIDPFFLLLIILGLFLLQFLLFKFRLLSEDNVFPFNRLKDKNYLFIIVIFLIVIYIFHINGGSHFSIDDKKYYAYVKSLVIDGNLDFENDFQQLQVEDTYHLQFRTKAGRPPNIYPPGSMTLWLPFFIFIHLVLKIISNWDLGLLTNGLIQPYRNVVGLATILYAFLTSLLLYRLLKEYVKKSIALVAVMTIILATFLIYYIVFTPLMSTICEAFVATLFIFLWLKQRKKNSNFFNFVLGLVGGLLIFMRLTFAIFLLLPFFDIIRRLFFSKDRKKGIFGRKNIWLSSALLIGIILGALPLLFVWKSVYGEWLVSFSRYFSHLHSPFILKVLFSCRHGLISWSPIILFSLVGMIMFAFKYKDIGLGFIIVFLLTLYINASQKDWWAGGSFGARRFASLAVIFAFGLAYFLQWIYSKAGKKGFVCVIVIVSGLIVWNFLLLYQFEKNLINRSSSISPAVMIKNNKDIILTRSPQALKLTGCWLKGLSLGITAEQYYHLKKLEPFSNDFQIDIGSGDELFIGKNWGSKDREGEVSFRWSLRGSSTILFPLKETSPYLLLIHCWPYTYPDAPPQSIRISINDRVLSPITLNNQTGLYNITIPQKYFQKGINEIKIYSAYSIRPAYFNPNLDPRKISVAFDSLSFKAVNP